MILDSLVTGRRAAVGDLSLVVGDIRDAHLVELTVREHAIEAVVHFAALKSVEASMYDPFGYFDVNVAGTMVLARAAIGGGVDRLVFSSSCAVYGRPDTLPVDKAGRLVPENRPERRSWQPSGCSARSSRPRTCGKSPCDISTPRASPTIARPVRIGPGPSTSSHPSCAWAWGESPRCKCMARICRPRTAQRYATTCTCRTSPRRTPRALDYLAHGGESIALNIGTGRGASVREVIRSAEAVVGHKIPVVEVGRRAAIRPRTGLILDWHPSS